MKRNGNAERSAEGAEGVGVWGGGSSPQWGRGLERGPCPLPRNFFDFLSGNGAFWCIIGTCFNVSIRRVKQSRKAVLCANCQLVSYLTWQTYHPWYHTHKHIISQSAVSQSNTHAPYTINIVDIHVHAIPSISILLSCIFLLQQIQPLFTKVTFC